MEITSTKCRGVEMGPSNKEDPEDRNARLRERRESLLERRMAAEEQARDMTTDYSSVYGVRNISMFGMPGTKPKPKATPAPRQNNNMMNDR